MGFLSIVILYSIFYLLQPIIGNVLSYTIGYLTSFIFNYCLTASYTFKKKASIKNGLGFVLSHLTNYILQITLLSVIIKLGISYYIAPIPVLIICVPTNYLMVRFFFKRY